MDDFNVITVPYNELEQDLDERMCLEGIPFTGRAIDYSEDGSVSLEIDFVNGLYGGRMLERYPSGSLKYDQSLKDGVLHGPSTWYYRNGKVKKEGVYEFGICLRSRNWNLDGELTEDFELKPGDEDYCELTSRRAAYIRFHDHNS